MKIQETYQEGPVQYHRRRNPWFAILLALMSIPLIIGGIGLLVFAGLTIAGVTFLVLTILLLVVGTSLLIAAGVYFAVSSVHVETRRFSVNERPWIVVNNEVGTFHVNAGSDANIVTIQTTHYTRRFRRRTPKSRVRYEQVKEGNEIKARVDRVLLPGLNLPQDIDFDITVPGHADLELTTGAGDIWVTGISGQLTLRSDAGSIYVKRGLLNGNSLLQTDLGSINLHEAIDSTGTYELTTGAGSVNVILPGEAAFELDASTSLGSITTKVPGMAMDYSTNRELHGTLGSPPRASLTLRSDAGSVNVYEESVGHYPDWKEKKGTSFSRGNSLRSAVTGGLTGGIFFLGIALAILSGHFWTILFATMALAALVGSLSSPNAQAIYGGFQGFVFFVGLAICTVVGWWPWILVVLGVSAILGTLNGLWYTRYRGGQPIWWEQ